MLKKIFQHVLIALGARKIIKLEGVDDFNQLSAYDVGLMIDAYFAGGDDNFAGDALSEFMYWDIEDSELVSIQKDLVENAFLSVTDGIPEENTVFLKAYAIKLKKQVAAP